MTREEIEAKVISLVAKTLNKDEADVQLKSSFKDDLEADSLGIAELGMAFEDEFEISMDEDNLESINVVEDAVNIIQDLVG